MNQATLVLPVRDGKILLGMKKRGFGQGKINGFGGKIEEGETIAEAAVRELSEEVGLETTIKKLSKVGELNFFFPHSNEGWDKIVHVFLIDSWKGEPTESEEMGFEWHDIEKIPFERMWDDDKHWIPKVLNGKTIKGKFSFGEDNSTIANHEIIEY